MPRKRVIDPEFWSDEEIGGWSFASRLFYIGLWNFADDEGRFKANETLLKCQIFPYDKVIDINKIKSEIGNKVLWYEIDNLKYGYIRNFNKYQRIDRPTTSKLPPPEQLDEHSTSPRRVLAPNISKDNISKDKDVCMTNFEKFYSIYPRHVARDKALKAFLKLAPDDELLSRILSAVEAQSKTDEWLKENGKFIPYPASWLNAKRWEDEIKIKKNENSLAFNEITQEELMKRYEP